VTLPDAMAGEGFVRVAVRMFILVKTARLGTAVLRRLQSRGDTAPESIDESSSSCIV
jgi:hypothetical protein